MMSQLATVSSIGIKNSTIYFALPKFANVINQKTLQVLPALIHVTSSQIPLSYYVPARYKTTVTTQNQPKIDFSDHKSAFEEKSTGEIIRSLFILKICSYDIFVNNSLKIMTAMKKVIGEKIFDRIMKSTFYEQFVAGDNEKDMASVIKRLETCHIRPMIACMMEDDVTSNISEKNKECDNNKNRIIKMIHLLGKTGNELPALQVKITGIIPVSTVVNLNLRCQESDNYELVNELEKGIIAGHLETRRVNDDDKETLQKGLNRLQEIAVEAKKCGVLLLIDAEFISMNDTFNAISLGLMKIHNKEMPLVWDTIQCYLKDAKDRLTSQLKIANALDIHYAAKIVRGAYMEQERQLARELSYPDPVNDTYEETGIMYNKVVSILLDNIGREEKARIIIATHNEDAIHNAIQKLTENGINKSSAAVSFAQLYGMCEQVTLPLSKAGYAVYKSIPYGTVSEVLPYLYRRATENRAVLKGARKERELLWRELKRRLL